MAHVTVERPDISLDEPKLIDGLPGEGLVGKLVADRLVSEFEMEYFAGVHCEGVRPVAAYRPGDTDVRPPVQLYADADRDLLVLVSDIPVSTSSAPAFAECLTRWFRERGVTPIYTSGLTVRGAEDADEGDGEDGDADRARQLYGLSTGDGDRLLDATDVAPPEQAGMVTGPTGALLNRAGDEGIDSVGFLVETDGSLPDYDAALAVVEGGVVPVTGVEIDPDPFTDRSVELSPVAASALQQLGDSGDGSTGAQPTATFH